MAATNETAPEEETVGGSLPATVMEKVVLSMYGVLSPAGCVGNLVVVLLVVKSTSLRKNTFMLAFTSLAVCDFLNFALTIPVIAVNAFVPRLAETAANRHWEKFAAGLQFGAYYTSEFLIILIAVARYAAVCHPTSRVGLFFKSVRGMMFCLVFLWVVPGLLYMVLIWSDLICLKYVRDYLYFGSNSTPTTCPAMALIEVVAPTYAFIVTGVSFLSYVAILLRRVHHRVKLGHWYLAGQQQNAKKELYLTLQCFIPLVIYIASIVSYNVTYLYLYPRGIFLGQYWSFYLFAITLIHHSCNPVVYFIFNQKLRAEFLRKFTCSAANVGHFSSTAQIANVSNIVRGGAAVSVA